MPDDLLEKVQSASPPTRPSEQNTARGRLLFDLVRCGRCRVVVSVCRSDFDVSGQKLAERLNGDMINDYGGDRNRKRSSYRLMPATLPDAWKHVTPGGRVPHRRTACLECTRRQKKPVWLCPECHDNHLIWDHEVAKPASHRVTVG